MIIAFCLLGMAVGAFVMAAGVAKDECEHTEDNQGSQEKRL